MARVLRRSACPQRGHSRFLLRRRCRAPTQRLTRFPAAPSWSRRCSNGCSRGGSRFAVDPSRGCAFVRRQRGAPEACRDELWRVRCVWCERGARAERAGAVRRVRRAASERICSEQRYRPALSRPRPKAVHPLGGDMGFHNSGFSKRFIRSVATWVAATANSESGSSARCCSGYSRRWAPRLPPKRFIRSQRCRCRVVF